MKKPLFAVVALAVVLTAGVLFLLVERTAMVIRFLPLILIIALMMTAVGVYLAIASGRSKRNIRQEGDETWVKVNPVRRKEPPQS